MEQSVTIKAVIDIAGMRHILSCDNAHERVILADAQFSSIRRARSSGCLGVDSVSKFSIFLFNSISVIGFTIWHSSCDRRNTMPATALLRMLLFLRFLALLLEWYHLFHW